MAQSIMADYVTPLESSQGYRVKGSRIQSAAESQAPGKHSSHSNTILVFKNLPSRLICAVVSQSINSRGMLRPSSSEKKT